MIVSSLHDVNSGYSQNNSVYYQIQHVTPIVLIRNNKATVGCIKFAL